MSDDHDPSDSVREIEGLVLLILPDDGPVMSSEQDAVGLVGEGLSARADLIVVPVERLSDTVFDLRSGLLGAMAQKFVNYGLGLVILGDISRHVARSAALRDFVYESNQGRHLWFASSLGEVEARLGRSRLGR